MAADLAVSVRDRSKRDQFDGGHLAAGLLIAPSTVLVPDPTDALLQAEGVELDVLLMPTPLRHGSLVEQIPVAEVRVPDDSAERPGLLLIKLAVDSGNEPSLIVRPVEPGEASDPNADPETLERGGLWGVLERHGAVPRREGRPALAVRDLTARIDSDAGAPRWDQLSPGAVIYAQWPPCLPVFCSYVVRPHLPMTFEEFVAPATEADPQG